MINKQDEQNIIYNSNEISKNELDADTKSVLRWMIICGLFPIALIGIVIILVWLEIIGII